MNNWSRPIPSIVNPMDIYITVWRDKEPVLPGDDGKARIHGIGVVFRDRHGKTSTHRAYVIRENIRRSELELAIELLKMIDGSTNVTFHVTEGNIYLVNSVHYSRNWWCNNGWLKRNGDPVENSDLLKKMNSMDDPSIKWVVDEDDDCGENNAKACRVAKRAIDEAKTDILAGGQIPV